MTGLVTGKEYSFRVQVVSTNGISPMSEEVTNKAA
ncbi:MAG: fibronectin type III domain-containing protein [Flavobacteriales bacterium]|nr:fibronectin type III domain-containing protein [Flavobacteriales bacterium]